MVSRVAELKVDPHLNDRGGSRNDFFSLIPNPTPFFPFFFFVSLLKENKKRGGGRSGGPY